MAEGWRMWSISLLTIMLLTLLSAAPIDINDDIKKEDVKADDDAMHSHDENVTRGGKFFGHNQFDLGNINVSGSVAGDDVSIGHEVNIDVQGHTHDHHHHEDNAGIIVDGGWSAWSSWNDCTGTCEEATKTRTRACSGPAADKSCPGEATQTQSCDLPSCEAVDGGWSNWSEYGQCSKSCGGGRQTRTRTCTNPVPHHNGRTCEQQIIGDPTETKDCNLHDCDLEGFFCLFNDAELDLSPGDGQASPVDRAYKWENNLIPYFFTSASDEDKALFKSVMDIIGRKTCFKFKEETEDACGMKQCLEIMIEQSKSCSTGCQHGFVGITKLTPYKRFLLKSDSHVGDKADCTLRCQGFALHELMHVLGVGHTVNRRDRDSFIEINEKNVEALGIKEALNKCENCLLYDGNYDCSSIMHMGTHFKGTEVLKPKDPNACSLKKHAKVEDGPFGSDLDWKLLNGIGDCTGDYIMYTVKKCWSVDQTKATSDEWCTNSCLHTSPDCPENLCKCSDCTTDYGRCNGKQECTYGLDEYDCPEQPNKKQGVLKEVKECLSLDDQHSDEWCTKNCRHTPPNCPEDVCKCKVWHTLFESTSGSCLDYIENRHYWTDSTGNGVAQLTIPLEEDIKSYEIQMETDVPLTGLQFWTADAVPSTGTIFRITPNSDSKFSGANKGQKLRLKFQMTYEGSEQPTAFSIIFNDKTVCDDTSVCTAGELSSKPCFCKAASIQKGEWCTAEQKCNEDGTCFDVMSIIDAIRGLRVTVHVIFNVLEKKEYTIREEEKTLILDIMSNTIAYLKDYCSNKNSNCESAKIVGFKTLLESLSKMEKIQDPEFLNSFQKKRGNLDLEAIKAEDVFKPPPKPATVCNPGPEEDTCACENAAEPCKAGEFCAEGRCLKVCGASDDLNKFLKADCFCTENGGQICPKSNDADKQRCGGGNLCDKVYGCVVKVCPIFWMLIG